MFGIYKSILRLLLWIYSGRVLSNLGPMFGIYKSILCLLLYSGRVLSNAHHLSWILYHREQYSDFIYYVYYSV